jgi:hypothetical protein
LKIKEVSLSKKRKRDRKKKYSKKNDIEITQRFLEHFGIEATNCHHLVPRSRCKRMSLKGDDSRNKKITRQDIHFAWHFLFKNKTPEEAAIYIFANFFPDPSFWLPKNLVLASLVKKAKSRFVLEEIVEDILLMIISGKQNFNTKKIKDERIRKFFEELMKK